MGFRIDGAEFDRGAGRVMAQIVIALPVACRSDWARDKPAAAVGADVVQYGFDTLCAKGALITAYARIRRVRGQGCVAVFTGGPEFQHKSFSLEDRLIMPVVCSGASVSERMK